MPYYRGDGIPMQGMHQGDLFRNIGRTFKRAVRDIGKAVKFAAPILAPVLPVFGAATAVGKAVSIHGKVMRARDLAQQTVNGAYGVGLLPPLPVPTLSVTTRADPPAVAGVSRFAAAAPAARRAPTKRRKKRTTARRTTRRRSSARRSR